jgi:Na+(H+)/acetate symporter ActP
MQFFILFIGAMVFVFYIFIQPPVLFQHAELSRIARNGAFPQVELEYKNAFADRSASAMELLQAHHDHDSAGVARGLALFRNAQQELDAARGKAAKMVTEAGGEKGFTDTNYIFLSFVTKYLPVGLVGLVIAVIFAATMSASSGEINSLATVTIVDLYKRHFRKHASDHHYVTASRWATLFWGVYAVMFAGWAGRLGALIVAVNKVGSLFYGSLLGCFVLAFVFRRVRGTATFVGMLAGESAILATAWYTDVSWLWYNVIGSVVVVAVALAITGAAPGPSARPDTLPAR